MRSVDKVQCVKAFFPGRVFTTVDYVWCCNYSVHISNKHFSELFILQEPKQNVGFLSFILLVKWFPLWVACLLNKYIQCVFPQRSILLGHYVFRSKLDHPQVQSLWSDAIRRVTSLLLLLIFIILQILDLDLNTCLKKYLLLRAYINNIWKIPKVYLNYLCGLIDIMFIYYNSWLEFNSRLQHVPSSADFISGG